MRTIRTIYYIAQADLLERIRQYSFMLMIAITMLLAYFFVPPVDAGYITMSLEQSRGVYNSAWVAGSVALSTTIFLSLFGFYLVKNSIDRDRRSRVSHIIGSTPVKKLYYMIGKWCSNFIVLAIIVAFIMLIALIMQWVRGEVMKVELWPLLSPFLLVTLPLMAVIASLALLFESIKWLQGGIGNVIYFILYMIISTSTSFEVFGISAITSDMILELSAIDAHYNGNYSAGILFQEGPTKTFVWTGVDWTVELVLQQLSLFLVAFLIIPVTAIVFRGFKAEEDGQTRTKAKKEWMESDKEHSVPRIRPAQLTPVVIKDSFWALVRAEWQLMMKGASLIWYMIALILCILCMTLPVTASSQWMIWPLTWIWPMLLWSGMGNKEIRFRTEFLIASSPRYVFRQLTAVWIAGVLLSCVTGSGMFIRFVLERNVELLIYWVSAAILIPSLALALGILTRNNRAFEVIYMLLWYLGPFNKMPFLDFMGTSSKDGTTWITESSYNPLVVGFVYLLIGAALLAFSYIGRSRLTHSM
ncbi:ABC transporter permease [Paenibacillus sp. L3-i20]|uniref:ABC transporter permease n=1 Tax=Paenibacillus sp. L3-i20 TaxID=2905833 RepID=UPI001EDDE1C8|nr:hypothetical protein [Paenibacillus sp. L3-i20]GKU76375.1 ABC transporter permease [Paenibacillus sp. L3-i20]